MSVHEPDELLLGELRRIAAVVDPIPEALLHAGRESLTWLRVDAELAELLSDSMVDDEVLAHVRSSGGVRAVTFEADGFTIELDILGEGAHRTLVGQLVPAGAAEIEVQTSEAAQTVAADTHGRFRAENVPEGGCACASPATRRRPDRPRRAGSRSDGRVPETQLLQTRLGDGQAEEARSAASQPADETPASYALCRNPSSRRRGSGARRTSS